LRRDATKRRRWRENIPARALGIVGVQKQFSRTHKSASVVQSGDKGV
jgi:hypothetical protein